MKRNEAKGIQRSQCRAYRRALSDDEYRARSQIVCDRLARLPAIEAAEGILLYWPRIASREIDIRPLFAVLNAKCLALPVVDSDSLFAAPYVSQSDLGPNVFGIQEPTRHERLASSSIDVIVVPCLGADRRGFRIGYGHGYYDRFLANHFGTFICPVFDACVLDLVQDEPHDIPVHALVTETTVYSVPRNTAGL